MRTRSTRIAALAFALVIAAAATGIAGAATSTKTNRPWYAERLERLGFFVFDQPFSFADFSVEKMEGGTRARSASKGNIVLLNFWASWCPPCKEEMPSIENLSKAMKGKKFEVMAVNLGDTKATVRDFLKQYGYTFPVYMDQKSSLSRAYASKGIPTTYIVDKSGKFIAGVIGGIRYDHPEVVAIMNYLATK